MSGPGKKKKGGRASQETPHEGAHKTWKGLSQKVRRRPANMLPCRPLRSNLKIMEVKKEAVKKAIAARGQFNCSGTIGQLF